MKILRRTAVVLCLLIMGSGVDAGAQYFKTIGVREGLTDHFVTSIAKDSEGYMWFATHDGLDRFDGYEMKKYSLIDFGLNFDQFDYVAEDKGRNLWVISATGQVYVLDRKNDCLTDKVNQVLSSLGISSADPVTISVDKAGNLWAATSHTLYHYDYDARRLDTYAVEGQCHQIVSDGKASYVSFRDGSIMMITGTDSMEVIRKSAGRVDQLMIDSRGRLWTYGYSKRDKIMYYDSVNKSWNSLPSNEMTEKDNISVAIDDNNGHLWFGSSSNGILVYDYDLSGYRIMEHVSGDGLSIPNNHIMSLYVSDDNLLWIGTARGGAALTSIESLNMHHLSLGVSEDAKTIIENGDGDLLIGLDGKGLLKYSVKDGSVSRYSVQDGLIPSQNIMGSAMLSDGRIIFATYGGGPFIWDGERAQMLECTDARFHNETKSCRDIVEDNSGNIWFLTFSRGVVCLRPDGTWQHFNMANSELMSNHMMSITYSKESDRMFVCNKECIYEISTKTMSLQKMFEFSQVNDLYVDRRSVLWIGTTKGLWYKELKTDNDLCCLDLSDGMSHPHIMGIATDHKEDLWVTTNDGFTYIYVINDPHKGSIEARCFPYYAEDGLGKGIFCHNSIYCSKDGSIMMGYDGKVIKVRPDVNGFTKRNRSLVLTSVSVSGKELNMREFNNDPYSNKIKIGYNDNLFLRVSAMDYLNRNKIKYEYSIDGGESWSLMIGNMLYLNRIQSGLHTLSIRVAGGADGTAENMTNVIITVRPPFWKSPASMILYLVFTILIILAIIDFLQSRNRKLLDQERHEMDEAKLQFFTNISHDLRTPLTMIITPLKKLLRDAKGTPMEEDLNLINRSAMTLMNEVDQLLDFKKLDKDKISFNPSYGDIVRFINELLSSFNLLFTDDSIRLTKEICEERIMMNFDKDKVMRILHNLISNAFKFNHPRGYVKVTLQQNGDNVELIVTDSGTGIDDSHKPHIFERFYQGHSNGAISGNGVGLHIVKEYVEMHNGTISVSDNHPSGCIFTVSLPVSYGNIPAEGLLADDEAHDEDEQDAVANEDMTKILIVEDNLPFRRFMKSSLSDRYKVYEAGNGRAALESLEKHAISIIISDVMMPDMDGLELCREVKNDIRYSHIPIILLTAIQNKDTALKGLRDGADEYISKPFDVEMLTLKIDKILNRRQENYEKFSDGKVKLSDLNISRLDEELMKKIVDAIEKHLSDSEYSVEDLSSDIGVSRSGLYKKMMVITGKSPIEFIRAIKLKKGRSMLEEGETSISQIAWSVGFSPKQFSKYFKDEYGCLPSEYMKHIRS